MAALELAALELIVLVPEEGPELGGGPELGEGPKPCIALSDSVGACWGWVRLVGAVPSTVCIDGMLVEASGVSLIAAPAAGVDAANGVAPNCDVVDGGPDI